jgi:hypothetical protein
MARYLWKLARTFTGITPFAPCCDRATKQYAMVAYGCGWLARRQSTTLNGIARTWKSGDRREASPGAATLSRKPPGGFGYVLKRHFIAFEMPAGVIAAKAQRHREFHLCAFVVHCSIFRYQASPSVWLDADY